MRKVSYVMGLALALSFGAFATSGAQAQRKDHQKQGQAERGRGGRGGAGVLLRGINLTANQKTQVKALREAQRKEFDANRPKRDQKQVGQRPQRDTTGFGARRAEMAKRREQEVAKLRTILTNEQRAQFDKNVVEMKQRMADRGRRDGGKRGA